MLSERIDPAPVSISSDPPSSVTIVCGWPPLVIKAVQAQFISFYIYPLSFWTTQHCQTTFPLSSTAVALRSGNHRIWTASLSDSQPYQCRRQTRRHTPPCASFPSAVAKHVSSTRRRPVTSSSSLNLLTYT